jgi:hypothetical protein
MPRLGESRSTRRGYEARGDRRRRAEAIATDIDREGYLMHKRTVNPESPESWPEPCRELI